MPNPVLSDKALRNAAAAGSSATNAGWAAPNPAATYLPVPPLSDGPVSAYSSEHMTLAGTSTAAGVLFAVLLASAAVGWSLVKVTEAGIKFPGWLIVNIIVGFVMAIVLSRKPQLARILAPIYSVVQGVFLGAISHLYDARYSGIVVQAVGATVAVTGVMFFLWKTQVIKVTDRFRRTIVGATMGLMVFYGISMLLSLFGVTVPFLNSSSGLGILFSVVAAGLAAFNLALDFDSIERGVAARMPKHMEWYAAFGLMVTVVWLYLELLRLLAKLQDRR